MSNAKPRASLYLRLSVSREESASIETQEHGLRALAAEHGFEVEAVHTDDDYSGALPIHQRPAFRSWVDDLLERRAGVLMVRDFGRLSREGLRAAADILDALNATGGRLLSSLDRMDSALPGFEMVAAVLSAQAKAERDAIRARVLIRQERDRRLGLWTRERPYGYDVAEGRLVQRQEEADVVRELAVSFLAGASLRSLARTLTERGLPTPRATRGRVRQKGERAGETYDGEPWGLTTVRAILANPAAAGLYPHRVRPDGVKGRAGERIVPARDEHGEEVRVTDDPILSRGEFAAIQDRLDSRSTLGPSGRRRTAVGAAPLHPLSGLVRCSGCGGAVVYDRRARRDAGGRGAFFRCQTHTHNPGGCVGLFVKATALEEAVASRVLRHVPALDPDGPEADVLIRRWLRANAPEDDAQRRAAEREAADRRAEVADLESAMYERKEFPGADGRERWRRLYDKALFRLKAAEDALRAFPEPSRDVGGLFDPVILRETLEADEEEPRRSLYALTIVRVMVAPGRGSTDLDSRVRIDWTASAPSLAEPLREAPLAV